MKTETSAVYNLTNVAYSKRSEGGCTGGRTQSPKMAKEADREGMLPNGDKIYDVIYRDPSERHTERLSFEEFLRKRRPRSIRVTVTKSIEALDYL